MLYICSVAKAELSLNREDNVLRAMSSGVNLMLRIFILLSIMAASLDNIIYFAQQL
jgi:hypothetical protein